MLFGMFSIISTITAFMLVILSVAWVIGDDPVEDAKQIAKILGAWILLTTVVCLFWSFFVKWFIFSYLPWLFTG